MLGVSREATQSEIKRAYYQLAKKLHPDTNNSDPAAAKQFAEVTNAYDCLGDAEKRKVYDLYGVDGVNGDAGMGGAGGGGFGAGFEDIFNMFNQRGGGGGFAGFGGGSGSGQSVRQTRGADLEATLQLSFMDAVNGTQKVMELNTLQPCGTCTGSGNKPNTTAATCKACGGHGVQMMQQGPFQIQMTCGTCGGAGKSQPKCTTCSGKGTQREKKQINVSIPAGVDNDTRVRLMNQGDAGQCNGPRGHLFVRLRVDKHPVFKRDNDDIHVDVDVPLHVALLGGQVEVPTLTGKATIKLDAGTQPYEQRVLRGKGVKAVNRNSAGNQYIHIKIVLPIKLNADAQELVHRLAVATGEMSAETATPQQTDAPQASADEYAATSKPAADTTATKPTTEPAADSASPKTESAAQTTSATADKPKKARKSKSFVDTIKGFVGGNDKADDAQGEEADSKGKIKQSS